VKQYTPIEPDSVRNQGRVTRIDFGKAKVPNVEFFNPTSLIVNGVEWLVVRRRTGEGMGQNDLVAFQCDHTGKPVAFIPVNLKNGNYKRQHWEDPRLAFIDGKIWLSYCTFAIDGQYYSGAHQQVTQFLEFPPTSSPASAWSPVYGGNGGSLSTLDSNEKNWTWFEHDGKPHCLYHLDPITVVPWNGIDAGVPLTTPGLKWEYGQIRGGSPPILRRGKLTVFFHSSLRSDDGNVNHSRYYMGAAELSDKPPFNAISITKEPLLAGSLKDGAVKAVVFPGGAHFDGLDWNVVLGVNDLWCARYKVSAKELESKLSPVRQKRKYTKRNTYAQKEA
jgi:predicted GH43/DUF377 family glycosyl hydrolase